MKKIPEINTSWLACMVLPGLIFLSGCGSTETALFYVEGNCGECKEVIEGILTDTPGVKEAVWDFNSSHVEVKYAPGKTSEDFLQQTLAAKGFETRFFPANELARKSLPECCQEAVTRKLEQPRQLQLPDGH